MIRAFESLGSVLFGPLFDLGFRQPKNVLIGVGRSFAAGDIQEVQAAFGLVQVLLVTGRITQSAAGELMDQGSGFGIVLFLEDDLFHGTSLLSLAILSTIIQIMVRKSSKKNKSFQRFSKNWRIKEKIHSQATHSTAHCTKILFLFHRKIRMHSCFWTKNHKTFVEWFKNRLPGDQGSREKTLQYGNRKEILGGISAIGVQSQSA